MENGNNLSNISYFKRIIMLSLLFFKLGIVNFGGGYALLPLLSKELVDKRGWTTDKELADYYAVGQCTPGAIAVNVSTFIGYKIAGILGGILATLFFVLPSFIIIFIVATVLVNFNDNPYVVNALAGINVVVFVLILSAIVKLSKNSIVDIWTLLIALTVLFLSVFVSAIPLYVYVIVAAILGFFINMIKEKKEFKIEAKESSMIEKAEERKGLVSENKNDITKKDVLMFIFGTITGLLIGLFGFVICLFIKNKKFKNGLIVTTFLWLIMFVCTIITVIMKDGLLFSEYFHFFRIGICAFGGGLATFPFLEELGTMTGWFTEEELTAMLAVSESTPGAMGINMSTYVGYTATLGEYNNYFLAFIGSMITTLGLVTPSIIIILLVSLFLDKFNNNKYVKWVFYGLRAASIGLICAAAYSVLKVSVFNKIDGGSGHYDIISAFNATKDYFKANGGANFFSSIYKYIEYLINFKALAVCAIFTILVFKFKKHSIVYIALGGLVGILLQMGNVGL